MNKQAAQGSTWVGGKNRAVQDLGSTESHKTHDVNQGRRVDGRRSHAS